jgi:ATP-binding cassette subfamily C (CFTR/MRP) protein 1
VSVLASRVMNNAFHTPVSLAADVLASLAAGIAILLSMIDHQRSARPSTLLALYLSASALLNAPKVRTAWLIHPAGDVAVSFVAMLSFTIAAAIAESISKPAFFQLEESTLEQFSGFWNRTIFVWLTNTFRTGYAKLISVDDLPALDVKLRSQGLHEKLSRTWAKCR